MKKHFYSFLTFLFLVAIGFFASACTRTIYVAAECPKPPGIDAPHDYMKDLNMTSTPDQFVRACLSTRLDFLRAYSSCSSTLDTYRK